MQYESDLDEVSFEIKKLEVMIFDYEFLSQFAEHHTETLTEKSKERHFDNIKKLAKLKLSFPEYFI